MNLNSPLLPLQDKLEKVILQLESNQILQQMRNDESLSEYKHQHIRQIIRQELQLQTMVEALSQENERLVTIAAQSQEMISTKTEEYIQELQNIEIKWQQFRVQKEKEKKNLENKYSQDIEQLKEECSNIRDEYHGTKNELIKLRKENDNIKSEKLRLESQNSLFQESIIKLKKELQFKNRDLNQKTLELKERSKEIGSQSESQRNQYEEIISKMQEDMHLIRQSWQRKCSEIQVQLREENNLMALEYEERMRRQLKEHAQNLKLGNNVIITDSEEIITKRVERVQQQYTEQIKALEEEIEKLNKVHQNINEELKARDKTIKDLRETQQESYLQMSKLQKELELGKQSHGFQIQRIKVEKLRHETDNKALKEEISELACEKKQLKQENSIVMKKYHSLSLQNEKYQHEVQMLVNKIDTFSKNNEQQYSQLASQKQELFKKDQIITQKESEMQILKAKLTQIDESLKTEKSERDRIASSSKKQKQTIKKVTLIIQKLHVHIRKLKRELQVVKDEVKCRFQMLKSKWAIESTQLVDHFAQNKEQNDRRYKLKMSQLLDEMEVKQKELIETINQEKEQLKAQITEKEELLDRKEQENKKIQTKLISSQQERRLMAEDLQKEKFFSAKLEQKTQKNEDNYYSTIAKMEKDVSRSLSAFHLKWSENMVQIQAQLDEKDAQIKLCIQKLEQLSSETEEQKRRREWAEEETKKFKRKYEQMKNQRDDDVKNHLKRLQQETKHRLTLERELKQMRLSIMRGTTNNNLNNFSFNDKQTGYTTNLKPYASKDTQSNEREKELSQIREMIAKTYKVVGETPTAERDIGRGVSKRNIF